jgi:hypothetical protein
MDKQSISTSAQTLLSEIDQKVGSYVQHWVEQVNEQYNSGMCHELSKIQNDSNTFVGAAFSEVQFFLQEFWNDDSVIET